jgi:hypothetical protein
VARWDNVWQTCSLGRTGTSTERPADELRLGGYTVDVSPEDDPP